MSAPVSNVVEFPVAKRTPAEPRTGRTLCPDPFPITEKMAAWLRERFPGVGKRVVEEAHEDFLDWTRSKRPLYYDWEATWRNSMKRSLKDYRPTTRPKSFRELDQEAKRAELNARDAELRAIADRQRQRDAARAGQQPVALGSGVPGPRALAGLPPDERTEG